MLKQLILLQRWIQHLIAKLDNWEAECAEKARSLIAAERLGFVRTSLSAILRLTCEITMAASSESEGQQQPAFWSKTERSVQSLYQQDSELDGIWILVRKERAIGKARPNYGEIREMEPMKELVL